MGLFRIVPNEETMRGRKLFPSWRLHLSNPHSSNIEIKNITPRLLCIERWNNQTRGEHIHSILQHQLFVE